VIAATPVREFAIPHIVADHIFPDRVIDEINDHWPSRDNFVPEVPGNYIRHMRRRNAWRLPRSQRRFWRAFNETLWPAVVTAVAEKFSAPGAELFGNLFRTSIRPAQPLTLMDAEPDYPGHSMHTHFYHCPHWAFTMLFYCDPADQHSRGTALHRLLPRHERQAGHGESSYLFDDIDWRTTLAMDTFNWAGPKQPEAAYERRIVDYRSNRLLAFVDGPLAFHSVPFDDPALAPDPNRGRDGGRYARRRIVRMHLEIPRAAFYAAHSSHLPGRLDLKRYASIMAPPPRPPLSTDDEQYRETIIRPFVRERLETFARAVDSPAS
jgi:hypothetical protein